MNKLLLVFLALLAPSIAFAVEGAFKRSYNEGEFFVLEYYLCDGDHSAGGDCAEFNLFTGPATDFAYPGTPLYYVIDFSVDASATTKFAGLPVGRDVSGSATLHTLPGAVSMGISATNTYVPTQGLVTHPYVLIDVTSAGTGAGNNDLEVLIRLFYKRP